MSNDMREAFERVVEQPGDMIHWNEESKQYLPKTIMSEHGHRMHSMTKRAAYLLTMRLNDFSAGAQWQSQQAQGDAWRDLQLGEAVIIGDRCMGQDGKWFEIRAEHLTFTSKVVPASRPLQRRVCPPAPAAVPEQNPIQEVAMERERQDGKWGSESDDQKAPFDWCRIIQDYAGWARTMAGMDNPEKYRKRMIQIAAIAVAAIESHDRRMGAAPAPAEPKQLPDRPLGAVHSGRCFIDRLEGDYSFECEAGPLSQCVEWQEMKVCYDAMAHYIIALDGSHS